MQITLTNYKNTVIPVAMLDDNSANNRLKAYNKLGFTPLAFYDKSFDIRYVAYRTLGYTINALTDSYWRIRYGALQFFLSNKNTLAWLTREQLLAIASSDEHYVIRNAFTQE